MLQKTYAAPDVPRMTRKEWQVRARKLFGDDPLQWRFVCPLCGHVQSMQSLIAVGLTPKEAAGQAYFSCEGRTNPQVGCDYTLGGLFTFPGILVVNPDKTESPTFEFDTPEAQAKERSATPREKGGNGRALGS